MDGVQICIYRQTPTYAHKSQWTEIPDYALFLFTATHRGGLTMALYRGFTGHRSTTGPRTLAEGNYELDLNQNGLSDKWLTATGSHF
jgi:hypothetical protein